MIIIGFVSQEDPFHDRVAWSGTFYKLREAIEAAGFIVRWIPYGNSMGSKLLLFIHKKWNQSLGRKSKWVIPLYFRPTVKLWARELDKTLSMNECDYLFFPCSALISLFTNVKKPVIYLSDATIHLMVDYYWYNLSKRSKTIACKMEIAACQRAFINIRSSKWAINSVNNDCHCDPKKCFVLEFGPNIETKDIRVGLPYKEGQLRILFSGLSWYRKGGNIAVEVVEKLRNKGIDARLIVAGRPTMPIWW